MSMGDKVAELKLRSISERRVYPRRGLQIDVKMRRCANAIYSCGRTLDLSMGGARLEIVGPREAHAGDRIAIAFENDRCPVTRATRMVGAEIVRAEPVRDGRQRVAVRFDAPQLGLEGLRVKSAA